MEPNTADSILQALEEMARSKTPIDPQTWITAAMKLNALQGDEDDKLFLMEHRLAELRASYVEQGMASVKAKMLVERMPEFLEARRQKAKIDRIRETIRLAKLRGRMASEEMRSGL